MNIFYIFIFNNNQDQYKKIIIGAIALLGKVG